MSKGKVLVTGGVGFIGSHTVIELVKTGYTPIVLDNLVNAKTECLRRVEEIIGQKIQFYSVDLQDKAAINAVLDKHPDVKYVIHFAGLKAVGESVKFPLKYYKNNIGSTISLVEAMEEHGIFNLVFSSSATVYGTPQYLPLDEKHPVGQCTNAYGKTKFMIEQILEDQNQAQPQWNIVLLRYFNPVGAHESGRIGEDPHGPPNNLMPYISQVAVGRREHVNVFGNDYDTPDGTGVRDYLHVVDLALGHIASLKKLDENCGYKIYNLGTGQGYSVIDMIKAMEKACGKTIPYKMADRRAGDVGSVYSDPKLALEELGWKTHKTLEDMCADCWRWQSNNPHGFGTAETSE